jgi:hypothetical protein
LTVTLGNKPLWNVTPLLKDRAKPSASDEPASSFPQQKNKSPGGIGCWYRTEMFNKQTNFGPCSCDLVELLE